MFRQPSVPLIFYVKSEAREEALCSALGGGDFYLGMHPILITVLKEHDSTPESL